MFDDLEFEPLDVDRFAARVRLVRQLTPTSKQAFTGRAAGARDIERLRCAAEAVLDGLRKMERVNVSDFQLLGLEDIRVFDVPAVVVLVSITHHGETRRLVGVCLAGEDPLRSAALAVLNATNRFLSLSART